MQTTRRIFQAGFLAVILIGVFVMAGNAERWCPFGGVEAIYTYLTEGSMTCSLAVTNFFALGGLLVMVLLLRRAFCSYLCPIGTITEWIGKWARKLGIKPAKVPQGLDRALALLKYGVLALILWVTWTAGELLFRTADPCYALISRHGEDITFWAYVVAGAILVGAVFTSMPFCRWLCPLAAVMNPLSRFGLLRIRKDPELCVDCGKCERACPMNIKVGERDEVTAARCTLCLSCVSACPPKAGAVLEFGPPRWLGRHWPPAIAAALLLLIMTSVVAGALMFPLPAFFQERGEAPATTATLDLTIKGVKCRGSANGLCMYLFRDDIFAVPGYLRIEAWPTPPPGAAPVRIIYDPGRTEPETIKEAIASPLFDEFQGFERMSPYEIEGYAPWDDFGE